MSEQAIDILISDLAIARYNFTMLGINLSIFDEQIKILLFLNTRKMAALEGDLEKFYREYQDKTKNITYSFESFLNYLIQQNLMLKNEIGFYITVLGREYLAYRVSIGKTV